MSRLDWTAIIVAIIALIGTLLNGIFFYASRRKQQKKDRNPQGRIIAMGNGQRSFLCMFHSEKLTKLEIKTQKACDDIRDLKDDIKDIKQQLPLKKR